MEKSSVLKEFQCIFEVIVGGVLIKLNLNVSGLIINISKLRGVLFCFLVFSRIFAELSLLQNV